MKNVTPNGYDIEESKIPYCTKILPVTRRMTNVVVCADNKCSVKNCGFKGEINETIDKSNE